jgi:hypothetical protein
MTTLAHILSGPWLLAGWLTANALSLAVLLRDLRIGNPAIMPLMRWVWGLTVAYSGPLGLLVYWKTGRRQIARDSLWRRGWRSVCHCYSGCGAGEVVGVLIAAGLLSLGTWWVSGITFGLAYVFGYAMTAGPLMQEGVPRHQALWDAFTSETASITVMEVTALAVNQGVAAQATIGQPLFWSSLLLSLTCGLLAAWPVNVLLIKWGIKEGMHDPRHRAGHAHGGGHAERAAAATE